ncbi:unnamed protein product [Rhizoctonia solani]|uniref:Retrotransposon gag domain-containing protein n=1 Tax=Rhizoctonia solani TaxID=456999 RepID=A0A8H3BN63_9AGAM|nr:unnamed protein product [Rhizoctonia solani]
MNLTEGQPKKWGQTYLEKLLNSVNEPILDGLDAFEAAFLKNWSGPAALQTAECKMCNLHKNLSASGYAIEFRIIASDLEWSGAALMAAF